MTRVVGIDLGTTHTVVASADANGAGILEVFAIAQAVAAGVVEAAPLLPSALYAPASDERDAATPAPYGDRRWVVGRFARARGAEVVGRSIASAKSWLAHGGVDRSAAILPWGQTADAPDAPRLSPIDAQATVLAHVRAAWDTAHPEAPLAAQSIVLTVPASFDEAARALTVEATRRAGIPADSLRLLEEPQAAFLDWARAVGDVGLRALLGDAASADVLVCDVGGGTSDFSLIRVAREPSAPGGLSLVRVAVGDHLLLGGDNMDLALAHRLEPRLVGPGETLPPARFAQLVLAVRAAKERLLGGLGAAPDAATVTLLGSGARLVGGAQKTSLERVEVEQVVLDGFLPLVDRASLEASRATRGRTGLVTFGLPYATDPAITRHLAGFLARSRASTSTAPIALLLNGGVFHARAIAARLADAVEAFLGVRPTLLPHADPDLAVARGAVAHGLALRGVGRRIGGGSAHGYYVGVEGGVDPSRKQAVCVLPRGAEPSVRHVAHGRTFALTVGRAARFELFASASASHAAGARVDLDDAAFTALPAVVTALDAPAADRRRATDVRVELAAELTELGTLELACVEIDGGARHRLAFELRGAHIAPSIAPPSLSAPVRTSETPRATSSVRPHDRRFDEAAARIEAVFKAKGEPDPRPAKGLVRELERLLGERASWPTAIVRPLFDVVKPCLGGRRRSAEHERAWWSLTGWLLRPGWGDPLDAARIAAIAPLFAQRLSFPGEAANWRAWWVAWRRIAGGLDEATQTAIRDVLDPFLAADDPGGTRPRPKRPKSVKAEPWEEVLRLASSLERVAPARRGELGEWLVERTWTAGPAEATLLFAALGRVGARVPAYASAHHVVPPRLAEAWLAHLLRAGWKSVAVAPLVATQLARRTEDRARDVAEPVRAQVLAALEKAGARAEWLRQVREVVAVDEAETAERFGEALPAGLRLID